jgi:uncharacterized protein YjbI with pentapeptide repeats
MRPGLKPLFICLAVCALPIAGRAADCTQPAEPKVDWQRCYVDGRDFPGHDLSGARLRETSFQRANLDKAVLVGVDGYRARFVSATMKGARLDQGVFAEADFTKADLSGASLREADLRRTKFFRANLRGADLTGAKTLGADFLNADLSGARWIDGNRICAEGSLGQCN